MGTWSKTKAMESCWGEDNMKVYTVNMKKAVAKCNQVDAPELELPPYRSVDRFVNTMLSFARDMESNQFEQLYKMMSVINEEHYDRKNNHHNRRYQTRPYMQNYNNDDMYNSNNKYNYDNMDNKMDQFKMMMTFKKMMSNMKNDDSFMREKMMPYDMMKSQYNNKYDMNKFEKMFEMISEMKTQKKQYEAPVAAMRSSMDFDMPDFEKMANFMANFRSKRAADTDALALNDRLKEKIQHVFEEQQSKVGNMTCVLREMNCLNAENEIDIRAMKQDIEQFNMPSAWFKNRYEEILDVCHEVATTLPEKLNKQEIETNFGPVDEILESFKYQITEDQLFTQVNQLLQGSEDEYM